MFEKLWHNIKRRFVGDDSLIIAVGAAAFIAFLGLLFAGYLFGQHEKSMQNEYIPEGYVGNAEEMIEKEVITCKETATGDGTTFRLRYDAAKAEKEGFAQFYRSSRRLRRDIEEFNRQGGQGTFFYYRNKKLKVRPYYHRIRLPYPPATAWRGKISFFQGSTLGTLVSTNVLMRVRKPPEMEEALVHHDLSESQWMVFGGNPQRFVGTTYNFNHLGKPLISVGTDEEKEKLIIKCLSNTLPIRLNGIPINAAEEPAEVATEIRSRHRRERAPNAFELFEDDRLRLGNKDFVMSNMIRGLPGEDYSEGLPLADQLVRSLHLLASSSDFSDAVSNFNLVFTIDQPLHSHIQNHLSAYLEDFDKNNIERQRAPACVSVVDANTGHVLAMATYPTEKDLEKIEKLARVGRIPKLSEGLKRRLSMNQNLVTIPIGSTTKPILASCVWETHPELRKLEVASAGGRKSTVFGLRIPRGMEGSPGGPWTPTTFLQKSSNDYMLELYMATLAAPGTLRWSGNRVVSGDFSRYIDTGRLQRLQNMGDPGLSAHTMLERAYDVNIRGDYDATDPEAYDGSIFQPLLDRMMVTSRSELPRALWEVSMERTNMQFDKWWNFRGDLVSFCVGGGSNLWSNIKLAEAFARIGTGKMVRARVIASGDAEEEIAQRDYEPMPISQEVLDLVHSGMANVVPLGTARRLKPRFEELNKIYEPKGVKFKILSKTGTARKRNNGPNCAAYAFYLQIESLDGATVYGGVACTTYLEDRILSSWAVEYVKGILHEIGHHLYETKFANPEIPRAKPVAPKAEPAAAAN